MRTQSHGTPCCNSRAQTCQCRLQYAACRMALVLPQLAASSAARVLLVPPCYSQLTCPQQAGSMTVSSNAPVDHLAPPHRPLSMMSPPPSTAGYIRRVDYIRLVHSFTHPGCSAFTPCQYCCVSCALCDCVLRMPISVLRKPTNVLRCTDHDLYCNNVHPAFHHVCPAVA